MVVTGSRPGAGTRVRRVPGTCGLFWRCRGCL